MATRDSVQPQVRWRVALWIASLLASVGSLTLLFTGGRHIAWTFAVTMTFALPGWFLYLPLVFALPDATGRRGWILVCSGALIGPPSLCGWMLLLVMRGANARSAWYGDPLAPNTVAFLLFAAFVGGITAALYVLGLKLMRREPRTS